MLDSVNNHTPTETEYELSHDYNNKSFNYDKHWTSWTSGYLVIRALGHLSIFPSLEVKLLLEAKASVMENDDGLGPRLGDVMFFWWFLHVFCLLLLFFHIFFYIMITISNYYSYQILHIKFWRLSCLLKLEEISMDGNSLNVCWYEMHHDISYNQWIWKVSVPVNVHNAHPVSACTICCMNLMCA